MVTNYELRRKAHKALKPCFPIVLLVALIAALPSLLSQLLVIMTDSSYLLYLLELSAATDSVLYTGTTAQLTESLMTFMQDKGWINIIAEVLAYAVMPVLQLGLLNCLLIVLRGGEASVNLAFSRVNCFLRSLGLMLLTLGKMLLWTLPGMAVSLAGGLLITSSPDLGLALTFGGSILTIVLSIRATYAYAMATLVQADLPSTRARDCIARSKQIMLGKRMQLFRLELLYIGWTLLANLVTMSLSGVIGSTISMVLQLVISVYMTAARCSFYEHHSKAA